MALWATLRAHQAPVRAVEFTSGGSELWSGDDEGWTVWWNLETRRPYAIWSAHTHSILTVKRMDNDLLVTHGRDNKLRLWRLDRHQNYTTTPLTANSNRDDYAKPWLVHTQDVNALNFCAAAVKPNIVAVPATTTSDAVDVYQLNPFTRLEKAVQPPEPPEPKTGTVMAVTFGSDDDLIIGYESGHIAVFSGGAIKSILRVHKQPVLSLFYGDGRVWSTAADRQVVSFLVNDPTTLSTTKLDGKGIASIDICAPLSLAATAGWDGNVRLFSVNEGELDERESIGRESGVTLAKLAQCIPTTKRKLRAWPAAFLAAAGKDGRIALYGITTDLVLN